MYICKKCGNYYQFEGSSITSVANKLTPTARSKYEEEDILEYEGVDFLCCKECGSNYVTSINVNTLPQHLQDQIYNTILMGAVEADVMKELKEIVKGEDILEKN